MQNPSAGVQPPLDKHLHLISGHQFPLVAQLNLQQAFEYLVQAPSVVKQVAPMSWTYVQPPQDGTIWLEWLSPGQNGGRFPSDGYIWADPEQPYRQNINGYTIELMVHQSGFRPGFDHMTGHARTRYHLIDKQGNINAPPPDPSLWIVHYHHAPQQRLMPTSQVTIDAYTRRIMQDRNWLEQQGRIERRDFMLHDREHWPHIAVPGSRPQQVPGQPGFYQPGQMPNQAMGPPSSYSQAPFPQQQGPPSAKRPRVQGPGSVPPAQETSSQDFIIDEEEFSALGDYFDHLTPREISLTRYQQHHKWMEEVFSSPYAANHIVPVDLGLGLMGELKGLTEGILQAPAIDDFLDRGNRDVKEEVQEAFFTKLPKEQVEEFNMRVQKHIEEGKAEIERMKAEHAVKMREWRKTHKLTQAEQQLRGATWKGHERAIFKPSNESGEQAAVVEDVIEGVEQLTGRKVTTHADAALINKGGLEHIERAPEPALMNQQQQSNLSSNAPSETVSFQQIDMDSQHAPGGQQLASTAQQGSLTPSALAGESQDNADLDLLNDGMDIDGADLNFDLGDTPADSTNISKDAAVVQDASAVTSTGNVNASNDSTGGANNIAQEGDELFNDPNFEFDDNDIGGTGDDVGDGLIDFGVEGMGDDSAFGDAIHGMDS